MPEIDRDYYSWINVETRKELDGNEVSEFLRQFVKEVFGGQILVGLERRSDGTPVYWSLFHPIYEFVYQVEVDLESFTRIGLRASGDHIWSRYACGIVKRALERRFNSFVLEESFQGLSFSDWLERDYFSGWCPKWLRWIRKKLIMREMPLSLRALGPPKFHW